MRALFQVRATHASYFGDVTDVPETQPPIFTPRLVLHHVSATRLITLFEEPDNGGIYEGCRYTNPHRVLMDDDSGPLRWRVPQVKEDAARNKWFVRWVVERVSEEIVGSMSFHGAPDSRGMIEIGLGVHPDFRGRGYAREALIGMWSWACEQADVNVLRYTVSSTNLASTKLIAGFAFAHVGVQIDDEDGPEEIYEMSAQGFRDRYATRWQVESTTIAADPPIN